MPRHLCLYAPSLLLFVLLFLRCAQVVPLSGGERDSQPPKLVSATPAASSTRFSSDKIVLEFDEYVQLRDLNSQLMISPRLRRTPEISAEGKEVIIRLNRGDLQPNTTYRLDLGKAIADMNESNSIPAFTYAFTTGEFMDSLRIRGSASNASNNAPMADMLVGLYVASDTLTASERDSLPFILPPDYGARTDASGSFSFEQLAPQPYVLFAMKDNNRNGLYDGESERVAFGGTVFPKGDSSLRLRVFQEEPARLFLKRAFSPLYGVAQIVLNKPADVQIRPITGKREHIIVQKTDRPRDTIEVLYRNFVDTLELELGFSELDQRDTVRVLLPPEKSNRRRLRSPSSNVRAGMLPATNHLKVVYPVWMDTALYMREKLKLTSKEDTGISARAATSWWSDVKTLNIKASFREGVSYTVKGDTGMVRDIYGIPGDTMLAAFKKQAAAELGNLVLNVMVPRKQAYVVQLLTAQEQVVGERSFAVALSAPNLVRLEFSSLPPGNYKVRTVFDDNANARWDTGQLIKKRQPEKVSISTKEVKLLADWDIEEQIEVKE